MDALTLTLAIACAVAILGQLTLPVWGRWLRERQEKLTKVKIARLLEAAADRQLQTPAQHMAKLGKNQKGVGDAD